ncbi:transglycosylase domain-containing protein [Dermatophilus congolensis]|uniref:Penicillin-binding protein 1A/1B n=1 Tax=Dermatophilus congolensis TaxID=1863 RepID=A0A239VC64_9MICO|nr:transglycosylase domain-containing protein [Dermatophilus congolensis]MBO3130632.1 PASTA domain-containing protein [Dermatophilus congolensis]MBO3130738.1 PASTA domain-containing protein [Dermatophilus congolensis]MBO3135105.1 PASTA domain-containing protein [Dermatophilus congolensis]MBO3137344.1 PASTA domain-containing protein [Dermatophilus congolensis]MBO3139585.1 PASTA domain-containing protein [Dermatophilus congolensis]
MTNDPTVPASDHEQNAAPEQREGLHSAFRLLGGVVAGSTVLGVLVAGIFMPVVGAGGLATKSIVASFDAMPAEFTASPASQQTRILAADGSTIATLAEDNRQVVSLDEIAPIMRKAQIAIEDERFYEHSGVDPRGVARALFATLRGDTQGASTITQQYVRQTLVTTALKSDNEAGVAAALERGGVAGIVRKLQEMKYAIALEDNLSKEQVLEGYLNLVYYGAGAYGVEAASQRYFSKRASKLTLPEAAMIAGQVQRPSYTNPFERPEETLKRRNAVLDRMLSSHVITAEEHDEATNTPLGLKPSLPKQSCNASGSPYFCEYVVNWLLDQPSLGKDRKSRRNALYRKGLKIETPFDPKLAAFAREELIKRAPVEDSKSRGAAVAVVQPGTGKVIATAQNTNYGQGSGEAGVETTVNWSVDAKYGASGGFQIGSTAKPFNLVAALEKGMSPDTVLQVPPNHTPYSVSQLGGNKCGFIGRPFQPKNHEGNEFGPMSLKKATQKSVNTAFVELASQVGVCNIVDVMGRMGLHTGYGQKYGTKFVPNVILGADNASPLTLASAYATLAAGGKYCEPVPVTKVSDFHGKVFPIRGANCRQAISQKVAYDTTRILESVISPGATGEQMALADGRVAAGKTGTADASVHTWFAGFTPQLATAAWVGRPNAQLPQPHVYGSTYAGPIWTAVMNEASKGMPKLEFQQNPSKPGQGTPASETAEVPDVVGRSLNSAKKQLESDGFKVKINSEKMPSENIDYGRVAQITPMAGSQTSRGSTVTITLSSGPDE